MRGVRLRNSASRVFAWLRSSGRVVPISRKFGFDRGCPVDRFFIERFLQEYAADIKGCVLEFGGDEYSKRFGGNRIAEIEVLDVSPENERATLVADLTSRGNLPSRRFDCIVCTQTLQFIYDIDSSIRNLEHMLVPGGILLLTVPGISQISRYEMLRWGDYWRFTSLSLGRTLGEVFSKELVRIVSYGNVAAAVALLEGLAVQELSERQLEYFDPEYEVVIGARAVKART